MINETIEFTCCVVVYFLIVCIIEKKTSIFVEKRHPSNYFIISSEVRKYLAIINFQFTAK